MSRFQSFLSFPVVLWLLAMGVPAAAQNSGLREGTWEPDGMVWTIACQGDTAYVGGDFNYWGPRTGCGVPVDPQTGQPAAHYPAINGPVFAVLADGAGGWFIGGEFSKVGNTPCNFLAHILASGDLDSNWKPAVNGYVYALARSGSTLYLGGSFSAVNQQTRNKLAAVEAATGNLAPWNPDVPGSYPDRVNAILVAGSTSYIGGDFDTVGGKPRKCLAAVETASGNVTGWNPNANYPVKALALRGATLYAGGSFSTIGGASRKNIAALDTVTTSALAWNPGAGGGGLRPGPDRLDAARRGGAFTTIGGQPRARLAALDLVTTAPTSWNPGADNTVRVLALAGSTVYAGGDFINAGGARRVRLAALDLANSQATGWAPHASGAVHAIAAGTKIYVGGYCDSVGGVTRGKIAALDARTGALTAWNPGADDRVLALAPTATTIYAGGYFKNIGGKPRKSIAALDPISGQASPWNPDANDGVGTLAVSGSTIYAGGWFTQLGGKPRNYIGALDAVTTAAKTWNPNASHYIYALATDGQAVYAGGNYGGIGGKVRYNLAALDPVTGAATDWTPSSTSIVGSILLSGPLVYIGKDLGVSGGPYGIEALSTASGQHSGFWAPPLAPGVGSMYIYVSAIELVGSMVFYGGNFQYQQNFQTTQQGLMAQDIRTSAIANWAPQIFGAVEALAVSKNSLFAGGSFYAYLNCHKSLGSILHYLLFSNQTLFFVIFRCTPRVTAPSPGGGARNS